MSTFHKTVLLKETLEFLQVKKGKQYIDATLGGGGLSEEVIRLGGKVLGIDLDLDAIEFVSKNLKDEIKNGNLKVYKGNFKDLDEIALLKEFKKVYGIVFDLGVSSHQLDDKSRGFSLLGEGPLDMRMDKSQVLTAEQIVNLASKDELYEIFNKLGEERYARSISDGLVRARRVKAIQTTDDLARSIEGLFGFRKRVPDYLREKLLKRIFQALRIVVNSELENLRVGLDKALSVLESSGRVIVISFHSLEDRIVKQKFQEFENESKGTILTLKPVMPSLAEITKNSRSKSAKMRVFEKL